jgi:hypothetical protein
MSQIKMQSQNKRFVIENMGPKIPAPPKLPSPNKILTKTERKKVKAWGLICIIFGILGVSVLFFIYFMSINGFSNISFLKNIFSVYENEKPIVFSNKETLIVLATPFIFFISLLLGGIGFITNQSWSKNLLRGLFGLFILIIVVLIFIL